MEKAPRRWWDIPAAIILVFMLYIASARLVVTEWTPYLYVVETITVLGTLVGLALGRSLFERRGVILLTGGYSLTMIPWQLTRVIAEETGLREQLISVFGRLGSALSLLAHHQPVEDPIFFVALMAILYWAISLYAGYQLVRYASVIPVTAPAGVGMMILQVYDYWGSTRLWFPALYLFLCLLLLGRLNYLRNQVEWRQKRIFAAPEADFDINLGILAAAAAMIIAAWVFPVYWKPLPPVERVWRSIDESFTATRQRLGDALAAVRGTPRGVSDLFSTSLALGRNAVTGNTLLFTVAVPDEGLYRFHWRARVYDTYLNDQWTNSGSVQNRFTPDDPAFQVPDESAGRQREFIFQMSSEQWTIITAAQPVWVSRAAEVILQPIDDSSESDVIAFRANPLLRSGDSYRVRSVLIDPSITDLREAGTDYPEWVTRRYLLLPDDFSPRVQSLALQLTAGQGTPYDKAQAVTSYLRSHIAYSETVPESHPGADPIEEFLFNWQEGFCNYYASSEVLMLRSLGIPARLAVGYAQGARQEDLVNGTISYLVQQKNTHAWPEVFFPGLGWVEFEPTANQPDIIRPVEQNPGANLPSAQPTPASERRPEDEPPVIDQNTNTPGSNLALAFAKKAALWIIIILIGSVAGILLWRADRRQSIGRRIPQALQRYYERRDQTIPRWLNDWLRWSELTPIGRAFSAINWSLNRLGHPQPLNATPAERSAELVRLLPEAASEIGILTDEHEAELFSPRTGDVKNARRSALHIRLRTLKSIIKSFI
jgi:hypothetical protein